MRPLGAYELTRFKPSSVHCLAATILELVTEPFSGSWVLVIAIGPSGHSTSQPRNVDSLQEDERREALLLSAYIPEATIGGAELAKVQSNLFRIRWVYVSTRRRGGLFIISDESGLSSGPLYPPYCKLKNRVSRSPSFPLSMLCSSVIDGAHHIGRAAPSPADLLGHLLHKRSAPLHLLRVPSRPPASWYLDPTFH